MSNNSSNVDPPSGRYIPSIPIDDATRRIRDQDRLDWLRANPTSMGIKNHEIRRLEKINKKLEHDAINLHTQVTNLDKRLENENQENYKLHTQVTNLDKRLENENQENYKLKKINKKLEHDNNILRTALKKDVNKEFKADLMRAGLKKPEEWWGRLKGVYKQKDQCINDRENEKNQKEKCMNDRKNEKNKYIADLTTLNNETLRASQAFAACVKKNEELKDEIEELNNELNNENKVINDEDISFDLISDKPPIECEQGFVWNPISGCRLDRKVEDGGGGKKKKKTKRRSTRKRTQKIKRRKTQTKKRPQKTKKRKRTQKSKKTQKSKLSNKNINTMCRSECNKTRKVMPLLLKKMGLSKGEISKKMKEHNDQCEGNCIRLMNDKSLIAKLIKK